MRTFTLVREHDKTGISGTGTVAEGVEFFDGTTVVRWLPTATKRPGSGVKPTTVMHESVESVVALHGHGRSTYVRFSDGERLYQDEARSRLTAEDRQNPQVQEA